MANVNFQTLVKSIANIKHNINDITCLWWVRRATEKKKMKQGSSSSMIRSQNFNVVYMSNLLKENIIINFMQIVDLLWEVC